MADDLQALLDEVRMLLAEEEDMEMPRAEKRKKKRRAKATKEIGIGDRVRVTRKDSYFGREGVVKSLRGKMFVYIQLDETPREEGRLIYKMRSSLRVVEEYQ